ncbi:hypothetical protein HPB51_015047 [Rhipicephalus microplus]|uniref:Multiple inositol polyphosphate phosphatase 1 n=1 Tax=Rhipicephalus microplus TaxID=6941 RepID=A0A9J6ETR6_RHIMP|nr:hypothetical protein HPB51_015047 [Rhipicephalus microplus]
MGKYASYTAGFKLKAVQYALEHGNRVVRWHFGVGETSIREKLRTSLTGGASFHTHLRAALYFTHAAVMKSLVAKLGLGRATPPLRAGNYCRYRNRRPWRSSHLVPFTANFALILFRCGNSQLNVLPILNERVVWLPGCRSDFCPLDDFLRSSAVRSSRSCDPEKICSKDWKGGRRPE